MVFLSKYLLHGIWIILIIYGFIGVACSSVGIVYVWSLDSTKILDISELGGSVQGEFEAMSTAARHASSSATNAARSIRSAQGTLVSASKFTRKSATSLKTIANYVGFEVLGWQPFRGSYLYFQESGEHLSTMGNQLAGTGNYLLTNAKDMDLLARDLLTISDQMNKVASDFNKLVGSLPVWRIKNIITYILIFLLVLHFVILLQGISIFLITRSKPLMDKDGQEHLNKGKLQLTSVQ